MSDSPSGNDLYEPFDAGDISVRRVTLGLSLLDCASQLAATVRAKTYDKIRRAAGSFADVVDNLESYYGVVCDDLELTVSPVSILASSLGPHDLTSIAQSIDAAATDVGVGIVLGYAAAGSIDTNAGCRSLVDSVPAVAASTRTICPSVDWGDQSSGIDVPSVLGFAHAITSIAQMSASTMDHFLRVRCGPSRHSSRLYHDFMSPEITLGLEVSGTKLLLDILAATDGRSTLEEAVTAAERTAYQLERAAQFLRDRIADEVSARSGLTVSAGTAHVSARPSGPPEERAAVFDMIDRIRLQPDLVVIAAAASYAMTRGIRSAERSGPPPAWDRVSNTSDREHDASLFTAANRVIAVHEGSAPEEIALTILGRLTSTPAARTIPFSVVVVDQDPGQSLRSPVFGTTQVMPTPADAANSAVLRARKVTLDLGS